MILVYKKRHDFLQLTSRIKKVTEGRYNYLNDQRFKFGINDKSNVTVPRIRICQGM